MTRVIPEYQIIFRQPNTALPEASYMERYSIAQAGEDGAFLMPLLRRTPNGSVWPEYGVRRQQFSRKVPRIMERRRPSISHREKT